MPEESAIFVEGRDMAKRHLFVTTYRGATYRWSLWKAKKLSAEKQWKRLFPGTPSPVDGKYPMIQPRVRCRLHGRAADGRAADSVAVPSRAAWFQNVS
jgi:hypothetical protein